MTNPHMLAAIAADLDDDTRRLAYADWLDENGDHDRAELIRVQCELQPLIVGRPNLTDGLDWVTANRVEELLRRERELIEAHPEWVQWPCSKCNGLGVWAVVGDRSEARYTREDACDSCHTTGNILFHRRITWDRGWPGWVHVDRVSELVTQPFVSVEPVDEERQGGIVQMWEQKPHPAPLLTALITTPPWGVLLRGVIVDELRPQKGHDGWWWWRGTHGTHGLQHGLQSSVFNCLPDKPQIHGQTGAWYPTEQAAIRAEAAAFLTFGRKHS